MPTYKYLSLLLLPALAMGGYYAGGWWNLATPACCFVLHPLLTNIVKPAAKQPNQKAAGAPLEANTVLFIMAGSVMLLFTWSLSRLPIAGLPSFLGLALSIGTVNGVIGITLAHEFIHRHRIIERWTGLGLLLISNYLHFQVEHIGGHHVYGCTEKDPHTARWGESFYRFLPRTIAGTYYNAWKIESAGLHSKRHPWFSRRNRMLVYSCIQLLWWTILVCLFSFAGLLFCLLQSAVAILLLHLVNYIQHYGLNREKTGGGKPGKFAARHAWESGDPRAAFNLFQLENHADHHMHPGHAYDRLISHADSPRLPGGYTTMIALALVPSLWFRLIHKRIPFTTQTKHHAIHH